MSVDHYLRIAFALGLACFLLAPILRALTAADTAIGHDPTRKRRVRNRVVAERANRRINN